MKKSIKEQYARIPGTVYLFCKLENSGTVSLFYELGLAKGDATLCSGQVRSRMLNQNLFQEVVGDACMLLVAHEIGDAVQGMQ